MKIFVANTTRQVQEFVYRQLEASTPRMVRIDMGAQQQLPGDWSPEDVQYLEEQHRRYGLVPVGEIDRTRDFIGVCYSVDKPVQVDKIRTALAINEALLIERGRVLRQQAAVAVSNHIEQQGPGLTALEISVVEEPKDGGAPKVAEGTRVTRASGPPTPPRGEGRAGRRRAA